MALKIISTASETLNDIILHTLQEQGIEKAEALEQQLFEQMNQLPDSDNGENDILIIVPGGSYAFVIQQSANDKTLLAVVHTSRLPQTANL